MKEIILGIITALVSGIIPNDFVQLLRISGHFEFISYSMDKTITGYGFILPWRFTFSNNFLASFIGLTEYDDFIVLVIDMVIFIVIFYGVSYMYSSIRRR